MSVPASLWQQVRSRANFACEYCGIAESAAGGELTVDHFRPLCHDGPDELSNLLYCCFRCNLYKGDYWPIQSADVMLWNPRQETADRHLLLLADGMLYPITSTGMLTLQRLRLNRPALITNRLQRLHHSDEARLLMEIRDLLVSLDRLQAQLETSLKQHDSLLESYRSLLHLLQRTLE